MVSKARVDLPEPLTPETTVMRSLGMRTSTSRRLCMLAPTTEISRIASSRAPRSAVTGLPARGSGSRTPARVRPVCDPETFATSSG